MADIISKKDRSQHMRKIKTKNTNIELRVRQWLHARGFRYRINVKELPGKPDVVLRKYNCVIFINGCFWHGHDCKEGRLPKSNSGFWENKIGSNRERDARVIMELQHQGWKVLTIWKCDLRDFEPFMMRVEEDILSLY